MVLADCAGTLLLQEDANNETVAASGANDEIKRVNANMKQLFLGGNFSAA